ncbi:hypothetical protein B0J18DRAFT_302420 [Chaetomium sp. MPI-SDFR-AT-0129]|nr:hypothetical protein B0J18DRAFT_302420 [Chaetomium sp. MPI-SDFR-AT-0129]
MDSFALQEGDAALEILRLSRDWPHTRRRQRPAPRKRALVENQIRKRESLHARKRLGITQRFAIDNAPSNAHDNLPVCHQCRVTRECDFFVLRDSRWHHHGCLYPDKARSAPKMHARESTQDHLQHATTSTAERVQLGPQHDGLTLEKTTPVATEDSVSSLQAKNRQYKDKKDALHIYPNPFGQASCYPGDPPYTMYPGNPPHTMYPGNLPHTI